MCSYLSSTEPRRHRRPGPGPRPTIPQPQAPHRNDVDALYMPTYSTQFSPQESTTTAPETSLSFLTRIVAFSQMHGFSHTVPGIPSVGSCERMIYKAQGGGEKCSGTLGGPPSHDFNASLPLRGVARISPLVHTIGLIGFWTSGQVAPKAATFSPQIKFESDRFLSRGTFQLTSGWPGLEKDLGTSRLPDLKIRSARKVRRRSSLPCNPRHEDATTASKPSPTHLLGAARQMSGVAALHPHGAPCRRRARHRLDAHDPAGTGGRRGEVKDLVLRENAHEWPKHLRTMTPVRASQPLSANPPIIDHLGLGT
ncbi:hypothetical protein EDB86DRAFT_3245227 [Lactarius hatsudake]|nr:hypothetical protein EDB86DRAFT_3245227 [Lactarius hatsudake]